MLSTKWLNFMIIISALLKDKVYSSISDNIMNNISKIEIKWFSGISFKLTIFI